MAAINPKVLLGKLNAPSRRALEAAAGLCPSRTNFNVEIEHWLLKLIEMQDGDVPLVLKHYGIDAGRVTRELTKSLDGFKTGNARVPAFSPEVFDLMREAWTLASLDYASVVDDSTFEPVGTLADGAPARAIVAARFPSARLIDNLAVPDQS